MAKKKAAKKATAKKASSKKSTAKKAPAKKKPKKSAGLTVSANTFRRKVRSRAKALQSNVATQSELVASIATRASVSKAEVKNILSATSAVVASELCKKGAVRLPQIAMLRSKTRPAKRNALVRNPATGETFRKDLPKKISVRARPIGTAKKAASCGR